MIRYPEILDYRFVTGRQSYGPRDCMLYALGTGFGSDPLDEGLLRYVFEKNLRVSPSMVVVLGEDTGWSEDPQLGLTQNRMLHGEEHLVLHRPLSPTAEVVVRTMMSEVFDLGDRGALLVMDRRVEDVDGTLLAEIRRIEFARADGGFGGPARGQGRVTLPELARIPDRAPDDTVTFDIDPMIPLIYRLSGDPVAIHVDPAAARAAGFDRPILHGLSTLGFCCNAVLRSALDFDGTRLARFGLRFAAPVFGGDRMNVDIWHEGPEVRFTAHVPERNTTVIAGGYATITET